MHRLLKRGGGSVTIHAMRRLCRLLVLAVVCFYAVAAGLIPSPLAAAVSACVAGAVSADSPPSGCDGCCPAVMCAAARYEMPEPPRAAASHEMRMIDYAQTPSARLIPHISDPALRPPNV
jgi:hypothetical protein